MGGFDPHGREHFGGLFTRHPQGLSKSQTMGYFFCLQCSRLVGVAVNSSSWKFAPPPTMRPVPKLLWTVLLLRKHNKNRKMGKRARSNGLGLQMRVVVFLNSICKSIESSGKEKSAIYFNVRKSLKAIHLLGYLVFVSIISMLSLSQAVSSC